MAILRGRVFPAVPIEGVVGVAHEQPFDAPTADLEYYMGCWIRSRLATPSEGSRTCCIWRQLMSRTHLGSKTIADQAAPIAVERPIGSQEVRYLNCALVGNL